MSTSGKSNHQTMAASYHHGNLQEALLNEGLVLLEEMGEAGFSLRELARRVGVTANASYRHFANKEALLMALATQGFRLFAEDQLILWSTTYGSSADKFMASGIGYVRFASAHPALFRLMFGKQAARLRSDELRQASQQAFAGLRNFVAMLLGLAADSNEVQLAATTAWALVHGFSHLLLDGQLDNDEVEASLRQALTQWLRVHP